MDKDKAIQQALKKCRTKINYKVRKEGIEELFKIDCPQRKDVLINLALHDKVFEVKELAFRKCQSLGLTYKGKPIRLGKKNIGYNEKDILKFFLRVKREANLEDFDLEVFKNKFLQINPEMYDVLAYEKGKKFDEYLENKFKSLPKKKK